MRMAMGSRGGGELPLAGITVFQDANGDNIRDPGEVSAVTGADGAYELTFANGPSLNYYVQAVIPAGEATGRWQNTTNNYERAGIYTGTDITAEIDFGFRFVTYAEFFPQGGETLVNQTTAGEQSHLGSYARGIAADSTGNYVVSWITPAADSQNHVFVRISNADGTPRSNEILVATSARGNTPVVAMSGDGTRFAVSWNSYSAATNTQTAMVRTFDGVSGSPVTAAVTVSPYSTREEYRVEGIAMDGNGDFAVLMDGTTMKPGKNNTSNYTLISFQRFSRNGALVGSRSLVEDLRLINGHHAVAMDGAGNFVVVYSEVDNAAIGSGIFAQRYSAAGAKVGSRLHRGG